MSNEPAAVRVQGLGKMHRIYQRPQDRLKQMLLSRLGWSWGHEFWALRQVSFEVKRGERLGIIGRNGSGKSTLLQIIAGILAPSEGEVSVSGRVSALLELGSGFNPEFTGRENAIMNGSILGIPAPEMESRLDQIAAFADIGEFLDQPVKLYSSGMFLRLAFAVATSVDAEIVLIDEALAVGDVFFQQKCYRRLEALRDSGVSVLLVSHSMPDIEQFCQRAVLLDRGEMVYLGGAVQAVRQYYLLDQGARPAAVDDSAAVPLPDSTSGDQASVENWPSADAFHDVSGVAQTSNGWARCTGVAVCDEQGRPGSVFAQGQTARFFYEFELLKDVEVPIGGLQMYNSKAVLVHGRHTLQYDDCRVPLSVARGGRVRFRQDVRLDLGLDEYTLEVGLATISREHFERRALYPEHVLQSHIARVCHLAAAGRFAVVPPRGGTGSQGCRYYGVAGLQGDCQVATVGPR